MKFIIIYYRYRSDLSFSLKKRNVEIQFNENFKLLK